jgi:2-(1,2-epoxy-1,2-dihydrophenyl)acetyl-CoA isomerase
LIGLMKAKALMLRNPVLSAADAQELGIVTEVVADQDLMQAARSCAEELATGPTRAYGEVKRLLIDSYTNSLETQMECETTAIAGLADGTRDARTGIAAFIAKEAPSFDGQ